MDYKSTSAGVCDTCKMKVSYAHSSVQTFAFTVQLRNFGYNFIIIFKHIPKITYLRASMSRCLNNFIPV